MSEKPFDYWEFFAADALRTGSKLYSRFAEGVRGDEELKAMAARAKPGQPHANVLFAAVHFLLLRGAVHPLREFYPYLNAGRAKEGDPFVPFRDFCLSHRAELEPLIATRVTNTNEVGRSAVLHPGFRVLADEARMPLYLIEIGPSAGLNLIWDKYGVRYSKDGAVLASIAPGAALVIECELRGENIPPTGPLPQIAGRVGLELNPVDLTNADDRDWLRALMWPDQMERAARMEKAIALFEAAPPEIRSGDALALLPEAMAAAPAESAICVYHTVAVYQFSTKMKQTLEDILTVAGLRRPVWRLSFEMENASQQLLRLIHYHNGTRSDRLLADGHPHGAWLEWRAEDMRASPL
ncbi:MAG TPA: DUF2332 domain-containing protein [Rhizomicrobium sp.]|nr:DUF2332 domain-containing protein [Rhizomicrobium sp.]